MKKTMCIITLIALLFTGCHTNTGSKVLDTIAKPLTSAEMSGNGISGLTNTYQGENVLTYQNNDGTKTLRIYSAPIEVSGNAITENTNSDGQDFPYIADGSYIAKEFPGVLSQKSGVEIGNSENFIHIYPLEGEYPATMLQNINAFGLKRNAIRYKDAFGEGVNLDCTATSFGVNTEIILPKKSNQNSFKLKLQVPDSVPDTSSPDYILLKTTSKVSEVKSILYTPLAVDKHGKWCYSNSVKLVSKDSATNTYTLEYTIDENFLNDKNTAYPVTLNQSIYSYKPKEPDTSIYSGTGEQAGHYLSPYMLLGDSTIKGEGWSYIRFESLDKLDIDPDTIISAKYVFHNLFSLPKASMVSAYAVTEDWCSINTRWFNRPSYDEASPVYQTLVQKKGDYSLDLTELIKEMLKNKNKSDASFSVQNSFLIRSDTTNTNMLIASGDNGLYSPLLEIEIAC